MTNRFFEMSKAVKVIVGAIVSLSIAANSYASSNLQNDADESRVVVQKDKNLEVIGVVGERSVGFFRVEMEKAELDFYEAFNDLAQDKKYKVKCRNEKRKASNIRSVTCQPQYIIDKVTQKSEEAMRQGLPPPSLKNIEKGLRNEREKSLIYAEKLITANPHLLEKLIALNDKQTKYAQAKGDN